MTLVSNGLPKQFFQFKRENFGSRFSLKTIMKNLREKCLLGDILLFHFPEFGILFFWCEVLRLSQHDYPNAASTVACVDPTQQRLRRIIVEIIMKVAIPAPKLLWAQHQSRRRVRLKKNCADL